MIRRRLAGDKKLAALVESEQKVGLLTRQLAAANEKNMELTVQLLFDDEKRRIEGLIDEHGVVDEDLWCSLMDQLAAKSAECEKLREACEAVVETLDYLRGLWGDEAITKTLSDKVATALSRAEGKEDGR